MLSFANFSDIKWGGIEVSVIIVTFVLQFSKALVEKINCGHSCGKVLPFFFFLLISLSNSEAWYKCRFLLRGSCACFPSTTGSDLGFISEKDGFSCSLNYGSMKAYDYNCITVFGVPAILAYDSKEPKIPRIFPVNPCVVDV